MIQLSNQAKPAAKAAAQGIVKAQDNNISAAKFQRTFPNRSEEPTPIIVELTTCVVLTGQPTNDAPSNTNDEANWDEKP